MRKQNDGRWAVRTCVLDHVTSTGVIAHVIGGKVYGHYPRVKKRAEDIVKENVVKFGSVRPYP